MSFPWYTNMNNQTVETQPTEQAKVTGRRRFLQKAGAISPVLLTFTSPTAFANAPALCMSQTLSGNISHTVTGNCKMGTYNPTMLTAVFSGGGAFGSITATTQVKTLFGGSDTTTLLTAMGTTRKAIYITAYINSITPAISNKYPRTTAQVVTMYNGNPAPFVDDASAQYYFTHSTFP